MPDDLGNHGNDRITEGNAVGRGQDSAARFLLSQLAAEGSMGADAAIVRSAVMRSRTGDEQLMMERTFVTLVTLPFLLQ